MEEPNRQYWLNKPGGDYQWQQRERIAQGNSSYPQQERWLTARFDALAAQLGRPVRALEFGCGFGRFARLFRDNTSIEYYGYDFSQSMVQPLLDDPSHAHAFLDRIRVAPTVTDAFGDLKFDVIFTVSVLIHNRPEMAERLRREMSSLLTEQGQLWFIENALTSLSTRENNWHGGCWVHDFAGTTASDMDICVYHDCIYRHGAYVLRPLSPSRVIELAIGENAELRPSSLDELRVLGLPRLQSAIAQRDDEVAQQAEMHASYHDVSERVQVLETELSMLRSAQNLRAGIANALSSARPAESLKAKSRAPVKAPEAALPRPPFDWDSDQDLRWMNPYEGFDNVCHVFNREWIGIRAAAGALPGHKMAISASYDMSASEVSKAIAALRAQGIKKLVIHGMSEALYAFILALSEAASFEMFLVWHGTPAVWIHEHERKLAGFAITLTQRGIVKRMNGIRSGMEPLIGKRAYPKTLLNMPPKIRDMLDGLPTRSARGGAIAFIPAWHVLHKNVASSTLAAHITPEISDIWLLDGEMAKRFQYKGKMKTLEPREGRAMLETMRQADVVLNISLIDCHPMVDLESLAVGTPCLRGPLFLDALDDHPYVKLTETKNVLSVSDISKTISNVLHTDSSELSEMMNDYKQKLIDVSLVRYREFLEL